MAYRCPICALTYESAELAEACEAWCAKHESCNLQIARRSREARS